MPASSVFSTRNCRARRRASAPSAVRTATSRTRAVPRTSSRFATFTHPMTSTRPTPASKAHSPARTRPSTTSANGSTCAPRARVGRKRALEAGHHGIQLLLGGRQRTRPAAMRPSVSTGWVSLGNVRGSVGSGSHTSTRAADVAIREAAPVVGREQPLQHADVRRVGHDADDRPWPVVEPQRASDGRRIAREDLRPQPLTDHDHVVAARPMLGVGEEAAR